MKEWRQKVGLIGVLGVFLLLSGCLESRKSLTRLGNEYLEETHGIQGDVVHEPSFNEGTVGDEPMGMRSRETPDVEFDVYLTGVWNSEVIGDDYALQKEAYDHAQKVWKEHEKTFQELGFTNLRLFYHTEYSWLDQKLEWSELNAELTASRPHHLLEESSVRDLYEALSLVYGETPELEEASILEKGKQNREFWEWGFTSYEDFRSTIGKREDYQHDVLLEKHRAELEEIETELSELGYAYAYGYTAGEPYALHTFTCEKIGDGECHGFRIQVEGSITDSGKLFQLANVFQRHPAIKLDRLAIGEGEIKKGGGDWIYFDEPYDIQTEEDVKRAIKEYTY